MLGRVRVLCFSSLGVSYIPQSFSSVLMSFSIVFFLLSMFFSSLMLFNVLLDLCAVIVFIPRILCAYVCTL